MCVRLLTRDLAASQTETLVGPHHLWILLHWGHGSILPRPSHVSIQHTLSYITVQLAFCSHSVGGSGWLQLGGSHRQDHPHHPWDTFHGLTVNILHYRHLRWTGCSRCTPRTGAKQALSPDGKHKSSDPTGNQTRIIQLSSPYQSLYWLSYCSLLSKLRLATPTQ